MYEKSKGMEAVIYTTSLCLGMHGVYIDDIGDIVKEDNGSVIEILRLNLVIPQNSFVYDLGYKNVTDVDSYADMLSNELTRITDKVNTRKTIVRILYEVSDMNWTREDMKSAKKQLIEELINDTPPDFYLEVLADKFLDNCDDIF